MPSTQTPLPTRTGSPSVISEVLAKTQSRYTSMPPIAILESATSTPEDDATEELEPIRQICSPYQRARAPSPDAVHASLKTAIPETPAPTSEAKEAKCIHHPVFGDVKWDYSSESLSPLSELTESEDESIQPSHATGICKTLRPPSPLDLLAAAASTMPRQADSRSSSLSSSSWLSASPSALSHKRKRSSSSTSDLPSESGSSERPTKKLILSPSTSLAISSIPSPPQSIEPRKPSSTQRADEELPRGLYIPPSPNSLTIKLPARPRHPLALTTQEVMESLERNASTIGKVRHPKGNFGAATRKSARIMNRKGVAGKCS